MLNEIINAKIQELFDAMTIDYVMWLARTPYEVTEQKMLDFDKYSFDVGSSYIKLWHHDANHVSKSCIGFIVISTTDKKFAFGDMLKAAGHKAPAKNFARGNILTSDLSLVRWTGIS